MRFIFNSTNEKKEKRIREKMQNEFMKSSAPLRALIADDDPLCSQLLHMVMVNYGFETTLAFDGKDALNLISRNPFDLVFLDINMPGLTGIQVMSKIEKALEKRKTSVPIVTYSSLEQSMVPIPDERGFYILSHWQKPMNLSDLATLAGRALTRLGLIPQRA